MSLRPPIHLGDHVGTPGSPVTRRSADVLLGSLIASGVFRRHHVVPLTDPWTGPATLEYDEDANGDTVSSDSYADLTGVSVTVTPASGRSTVVMLVGGVYVTHTAATTCWAAISDGTSTFGQQRITIAANGYHAISTAYVVEVTASTTFTLQAKKNAAGDANFTATRKHLAALMVPQGWRTWTVPLYVASGEAEVLQRFRLVRTSDLSKSVAHHWKVRCGVKREGRIDVLATFDGMSQALDDGVPFDLTNSDLRRSLRASDVVVAEVTRVGSPDPLLGTTVQVVTDLVGRGA